MIPSGQLYRAVYLRNGLPKGITFWADDMIEALRTSERIASWTKCPVLATKPLGGSIYNGRGKLIKGNYIVTSRLRREGVWPTGTAWHSRKAPAERGQANDNL